MTKERKSTMLAYFAALMDFHSVLQRIATADDIQTLEDARRIARDALSFHPVE
jgi:hypothetical protein